MSHDFDPKELRTTFGQFASGVTVVTSGDADNVHGMTANSFTSVSLDPALVLVSIANACRMREVIEAHGHYGLSILERAQQPVSDHFAGKPQEDLNIGFDWHDGIPVLQDAIARMTCRVTDAHIAGDHTLFIGAVRTLERRDGEPLLFFGGKYGRLAA